MKTFINKVTTHKSFSKALHWGRLVSISGIAQILVQALAFINGILIIRIFSTQEYALYTLANAMLGTMTLLSDGGIADGVMSQGGKNWQDRNWLGAVMATGMQLRRGKTIREDAETLERRPASSKSPICFDNLYLCKQRDVFFLGWLAPHSFVFRRRNRTPLRSGSPVNSFDRTN